VRYKVRPALVIVDMQNCFVSENGSFHRLGYDIGNYRRIIEKVKEAYSTARELGLPVFFSKALREKSGIDLLDRVHQILPPKRLERIKKVPIAVRGTWDAEIIDELKPGEEDLVVDKRRDSIFQDTEFEMWLKSLRIDTLVFTGVDTSICVESSLRDAFNRGYDIILLSDATASLNEEFYRVTLEEVREAFGLVMSVEEFFDSISGLYGGEYLLEVSI